MKLIKEFLPYLIILIVIILIRSFVVTPVRVDGQSMYPTLDTGQILLLKKYDKSYQRFDVVALRYGDERLIKRVIGLPGEHIQYKDNTLYVNQKKVDEISSFQTGDFILEELGYSTIPDDYYLVLGDNRGDSVDSRIIGLVPKQDILGVTSFRLWPFTKFGSI